MKNIKQDFYWIWKQKRGKIGILVFGFYCFISLCAPILTNQNPIFIMTEKNEMKVPIFWEYKSETLGLEPDLFVIDYKKYCTEHFFKKCFWTINPWDPLEQTEDVLSAPSRNHFFGTDNLGRDILARLIYGVRIALEFGICLWILSYSFGVAIGISQGYFLGVFDFVVERIKELAALIPILTMIILVTAITKNQSFYLILFLILIFQWMGMASQMRALSLTISKQEYCDSCRVLGGSHLRILFKHILPNSMTPIVTLSPFALEAGISLLASLDYLGFGLPPPTPSLGELLSQGKEHLQTAPWVLISPVLTILFLLVSINFIAQCLRDLLDPKKKL